MNATVNEGQTIGQNCEVNTISSEASAVSHQANTTLTTSSYQNENIGQDDSRPFGDNDVKPPKSIYHKFCPILTNIRPIEELSVADLIEFLKSINLVACLFSTGSIVLTWLWKIFDTGYDSVVFTSFLTCFAVLLLASDISLLLKYRTAQGQKVRSCTKPSPYPWAKPVLFVALAALTWGFTGTWESVLGGIYFAAAVVALYAWLTTPEFRPCSDYDEEAPNVPMKSNSSVERTTQFESDELACTVAEP